MSKEVLISRIKEMKCGSKTIPQQYIDCFNDYIEKVINTRVDQSINDLKAKLAESEKKIEELKGERLKFYTDDVRRTQVINGVHFDIEQLLVFSEYVEHENWVKAEKDKELDQLKQQLAEKEQAIENWKTMYESVMQTCNNDAKEIERLREELAEKDAEIERLTKSFANKNNEDLSTTINGVKFTSEQIIALQQVGYSAEYDRNQTAIAVLEDLRGNYYAYDGIEFLGYIDQQIRVLKGEE